MSAHKHLQNDRTGFLGTIFVALGSLALAADLAFLIEFLRPLFGKLQDGPFALIPTLGLSLMHAARAIAFDQIDYFSLISRILVLFTAMLAIIVGIVLLSSPHPGAAHADPLQEYPYRERETDNG